MAMVYDNIAQDSVQAAHAYITGIQLITQAMQNDFIRKNMDTTGFLEQEVIPAFIALEMPFISARITGK